MSSRFLVPVLVLSLSVVVACADESTTMADSGGIVAPTAALDVTACDVTALKQAAIVYLSSPEEPQAVAAAEEVGFACVAGNRGLATAKVLEVLASVQQALTAGNAGSPSQGNALVTEALRFAVFECELVGTCAPSTTDFTGALSPGGAFQVVGATSADNGPVIARGLPVGDTWVAEPAMGNTWLTTLGEPSIVYGEPAGNPLSLKETPLRPIQYEWNVIPDLAGGFLQQPVVGVCFDLSNPAGITTVQRNHTLLQPAIPTACGSVTSPVTPSLRERLLRMSAAFFGPQPLGASAQRGAGTGGRPTDFSTFAAVDAVTTGQLVFTRQPLRNGRATRPFSVRLQARTDNGTPLENIEVTLRLQGPQAPGATVTNNVALTGEGEGIARLDRVIIDTKGLFTICADVTQTDGLGGVQYVIQSVCSRPVRMW